VPARRHLADKIFELGARCGRKREMSLNCTQLSILGKLLVDALLVLHHRLLPGGASARAGGWRWCCTRA